MFENINKIIPILKEEIKEKFKKHRENIIVTTSILILIPIIITINIKEGINICM